MSDFVAEDNSHYSRPEWWDNEYKKCGENDKYEWFSGGDDKNMLSAIISTIPSKESKIINLGCGISHIQDYLYDHGYKCITNVDVSESCIGIMKNGDTRGMDWAVVDVLKPFPYENGYFDFALDKGTLDALITDQADQWDIEDEVYQVSDAYFQNVYNSLSHGGVFIQITFGQPHFRKRLFERESFQWDVSVQTITSEHSFHFYCYVCTKH